MDKVQQSSVFNPTILIWRIFGLWSDRSSNIYFRLYSSLVIASTSIYVTLFTFNLIYTPRKVEIFATQAIFYFTAVSVMIKIIVFMIKKPKIISNFETMDCKEFLGNNSITNEFVREFKTNYVRYFKVYAVYCILNASTFLYVLPYINYYLSEEEIKLPMCEYYFLTDEIRDKYFFYWYVYQTTGLASTLASHITSHTFICGHLSMAITQFKILNWNIENIDLDDGDISKNLKEKEQVYLHKFLKCLRHYEIILQ